MLQVGRITLFGNQLTSGGSAINLSGLGLRLGLLTGESDATLSVTCLVVL